jgi:hypothetical protein
MGFVIYGEYGGVSITHPSSIFFCFPHPLLIVSKKYVIHGTLSLYRDTFLPFSKAITPLAGTNTGEH